MHQGAFPAHWVDRVDGHGMDGNLPSKSTEKETKSYFHPFLALKPS